MSFNIAIAIHIFFMFPETKGRTLEEMEEVFAAGNVSHLCVSKSSGTVFLGDFSRPLISLAHLLTHFN